MADPRFQDYEDRISALEKALKAKPKVAAEKPIKAPKAKKAKK